MPLLFSAHTAKLLVQLKVIMQVIRWHKWSCHRFSVWICAKGLMWLKMV